MRPLNLKEGSTLVALLRHEAEQRKRGELTETDRRRIERGEMAEADKELDTQEVMSSIIAKRAAKAENAKEAASQQE